MKLSDFVSSSNLIPQSYVEIHILNIKKKASDCLPDTTLQEGTTVEILVWGWDSKNGITGGMNN